MTSSNHNCPPVALIGLGGSSAGVSVQSVNNILPDENGNVELTGPDISGVLLQDGSVLLDPGYAPTDANSIAVKQTVDNVELMVSTIETQVLANTAGVSFLNANALIKDGSVDLDVGYVPANPLSIVSKQYTDNLFAGLAEVGQIKVNYESTVQQIGVTDNVPFYLDINAGTPAISNSVTLYPASAPSQSYAALFDNSRSQDNPGALVGKLIENPIDKQNHFWRFQFTYANKGSNNNLGLGICLFNPTSGFVDCHEITLPSGTTNGNFTANIISIADSSSITSPSGYIVRVTPTRSDFNFVLTLESITRITNATRL